MKAPSDEAAFWALWRAAPRDCCFPYEVNRILALLLIFFAVSLLAVTLTLTLGMEVPGAASMALWVATGMIVVGIVAILFIWRTLSRRSAVLLTDEFLVWLDAGTVHHLPWTAITRESFGQALGGARQTRGAMVFGPEGSAQSLLVYRPYMRIRGFQRLMLAILERIQDSEPNAPGG